MTGRTISLLATAAILAGLADAATFASAPLWMRSQDLGMIPRALAELPIALLAVKTAAIAVIAWIGWTNRDLLSARILSPVLLFGGAALWSFGAVWNLIAIAANS
jgi:hypothetical protein